MSLLRYDFVQNALVAGAIIAVVAGLVGRFVVARNLSFAVHGIAEVGFTGAAGAVLVGIEPVLGLMAGAPPAGAGGGTPRGGRGARCPGARLLPCPPPPPRPRPPPPPPDCPPP